MSTQTRGTRTPYGGIVSCPPPPRPALEGCGCRGRGAERLRPGPTVGGWLAALAGRAATVQPRNAAKWGYPLTRPRSVAVRAAGQGRPDRGTPSNRVSSGGGCLPNRVSSGQDAQTAQGSGGAGSAGQSIRVADAASGLELPERGAAQVGGAADTRPARHLDRRWRGAVQTETLGLPLGAGSGGP